MLGIRIHSFFEKFWIKFSTKPLIFLGQNFILFEILMHVCLLR